MTSPRLSQIQRALSRGAVQAPNNEDNNLFMEAVNDAVAKRAEAQISAAKEAQHKAEADNTELRKQVAELNKQLAQTHKDAHTMEVKMHNSHRQEMETMCKEHMAKMQQTQNELISLRRELAREQQAKVRAETQKEAAEKMHVHMEQMVAEARAIKPVAPAPAPVITTPAVAPMPVTAKVTQRDENGRIVAISIMPST